MSAQPPPPVRRPAGRRVGESGTRDAILDAALTLFAARGYDGASMRAIAAEAGVDPALIRHFYGDKQTLFATAVADRTAIPDQVSRAFAGDPRDVGRRVADTYLRLWSEPQTQPILLALVRSATTSPHAAAFLREVLTARLSMAPGRSDGEDDARDGQAAQRIALAGSHLLGLAFARYVLRLPGVSDLDHDVVVAQVAPTIQRYLTGTHL